MSDTRTDPNIPPGGGLFEGIAGGAPTVRSAPELTNAHNRRRRKKKTWFEEKPEEILDSSLLGGW